ncbi:hypothetical protein D3C72_721580 [compost metagenome]
MPATNEQKIKARLLLGAPKHDKAAIDALIDGLDDAELAEFEAILLESADVATSNTTGTVEGVNLDDPGRRQLLAERMANLIGYELHPVEVVIGRG